MRVHVLLYEAGKDNEGIHSIEFGGKTLVLMFEEKDDADRYCGLLEAQDFPSPTVEELERDEIVSFCQQSGYEARFVESGFLPQSDEDRLLISPPQTNLDVNGWGVNNQDNLDFSKDNDPVQNSELENFRKKLEDLI